MAAMGENNEELKKNKIIAQLLADKIAKDGHTFLTVDTDLTPTQKVFFDYAMSCLTDEEVDLHGWKLPSELSPLIDKAQEQFDMALPEFINILQREFYKKSLPFAPSKKITGAPVAAELEGENKVLVESRTFVFPERDSEHLRLLLLKGLQHIRPLDDNVSQSRLKAGMWVTLPKDTRLELMKESRRLGEQEVKRRHEALRDVASDKMERAVPSLKGERGAQAIYHEFLSSTDDIRKELIENLGDLDGFKKRLIETRTAEVKAKRESGVTDGVLNEVEIKEEAEKKVKEKFKEAWDLLQDINALYEFVQRTQPEPSKSKLAEAQRGAVTGEYLHQKALLFSDPAKGTMNLQAGTSKLAPMLAKPYMLLTRHKGKMCGITIDNGLPAKGDPTPLAPGRYAFVIRPDAPEQIRIGYHGHTPTSGGVDTLFAGEIHVDTTGVITKWTNDSGHYATDPTMLIQTILAKDPLGGPLLDPKIYAERDKISFTP
jgi:hypothetical protein